MSYIKAITILILIFLCSCQNEESKLREAILSIEDEFVIRSISNSKVMQDSLLNKIDRMSSKNAVDLLDAEEMNMLISIAEGEFIKLQGRIDIPDKAIQTLQKFEKYSDNIITTILKNKDPIKRDAEKFYVEAEIPFSVINQVREIRLIHLLTLWHFKKNDGKGIDYLYASLYLAERFFKYNISYFIGMIMAHDSSCILTEYAHMIPTEDLKVFRNILSRFSIDNAIEKIYQGKRWKLISELKTYLVRTKDKELKKKFAEIDNVKYYKGTPFIPGKISEMNNYGKHVKWMLYVIRQYEEFAKELKEYREGKEPVFNYIISTYKNDYFPAFTLYYASSCEVALVVLDSLIYNRENENNLLTEKTISTWIDKLTLDDYVSVKIDKKGFVSRIVFENPYFLDVYQGPPPEILEWSIYHKN